MPTIEQLFGHDTSSVSEDHFEKVFGGLLEGVMGGVGNECRVVASAPAAMTVEVGTGTFITGGVFARISASVPPLALAAADPVNPRIDRVICRRDNATNLVTVLILTGTPAGAPTPPVLTRAGGVWEISLAQVYVAATVVSVDRADITDERRQVGICGYMLPQGSPSLEFPHFNNRGQFGSAIPSSDNAAGALIENGVLGDLTYTGASGASQIAAGGRYNYRRTGIVVGNDAGWRVTNNITYPTLLPSLLLKISLPTITSIRGFFGLSGAGAISTMVGSDAPAAVDYIGMQFSTPRADTTWQLVVGNAGAQTIVDSHVTVTTDPVFLRITPVTSTDFLVEVLDASFTVVGGCYFTNADNLPDPADNLGPMAGIETRTTAARDIRTYYAHFKNDL